MPVYNYTTVDDQVGLTTQAAGINDAGQIVGSSLTPVTGPASF
jgi:hypothetical protein